MLLCLLACLFFPFPLFFFFFSSFYFFIFLQFLAPLPFFYFYFFLPFLWESRFLSGGSGTEAISALFSPSLSASSARSRRSLSCFPASTSKQLKPGSPSLGALTFSVLPMKLDTTIRTFSSCAHGCPASCSPGAWRLAPWDGCWL